MRPQGVDSCAVVAVVDGAGGFYRGRTLRCITRYTKEGAKVEHRATGYDNVYAGEDGNLYKQTKGGAWKAYAFRVRPSGAREVRINRGGEMTHLLVGWEIAKAFHSTPEATPPWEIPGIEVWNINRDRGDNRPTNLRWVTREEWKHLCTQESTGLPVPRKNPNYNPLDPFCTEPTMLAPVHTRGTWMQTRAPRMNSRSRKGLSAAHLEVLWRNHTEGKATQQEQADIFQVSRKTIQKYLKKMKARLIVHLSTPEST